MSDILAALGAFLSQEWVASIIWAIVLVLATHFVSRIATRALWHFLNRDSNPLPSSSIIVNIARATIWIVGG